MHSHLSRNTSYQELPLAKPNFQFLKRQKELEKAKKQEEKKQRKLEKASETDLENADEASAEDESA